MRERRDTFRVSVGKTERNNPSGRPRRRWEDTIKMGLLELRQEVGMDWIDLTQDRDKW